MAKTTAIPEFQPVLTNQQVASAESLLMSSPIGVRRRMAHTLLTRSSAELLAGFEESPEALLELLEQLAHHSDYVATSLQLAKCAEARAITCVQYLIDKDQA